MTAELAQLERRIADLTARRAARSRRTHFFWLHLTFIAEFHTKKDYRK